VRFSCTASDIAFIQAQTSNPSLTVDQLETALKARSAACSACVFTNDTDARFGPVVYTKGRTDAFVNTGACFATTPGGSDTCGRALQQTELCLRAVCDVTTCGGKTAADACVKKVIQDKSTCGKYELAAQCPNLQTLASSCETVVDIIRAACGG